MRWGSLSARLLGVAMCLLTAASLPTASRSTVNLSAFQIDIQKAAPAQRLRHRRSPFLRPQVLRPQVLQPQASWLATLRVPSASAQPLPLRRINPGELSAQVYQQLPDFPLENQYLSSETGQIATDNTLVSRIIRYHIYIQERPTNFRLDWKLTLADYLGAFERMTPNNYPDYGLQENPMAADIAVIESLSPQQRDRLVNALYETATANP